MATLLCSFAAASLAALAGTAALAQTDCDQCELPPACRDNAPSTGFAPRARDCQRLSIRIESDVDFGRVVVLKNGGGRVLMDLGTGERTVLGDVDDLGGVPIMGRATVTGTPLEALRITLPRRVAMRDAMGGEAQIADFVTDLPALPRLDASGQITFNFTGTLVITASMAASGKLRGRVPISVEYQ